jgi:hypothetical protein
MKNWSQLPKSNPRTVIYVISGLLPENVLLPLGDGGFKIVEHFV